MKSYDLIVGTFHYSLIDNLFINRLYVISVYNTCTLLLNNEKYVDANLDATDNAISGNEPSSEMLTNQSQIPELKQVIPKSEDLSRSLEIKLIWTFDTEFPTIFNKSCTYITFKSAV